MYKWLEYHEFIAQKQFAVELPTDTFVIICSKQHAISFVRYPLGLGNLGDLQEISPTPGCPSAEEIFKEGIRVNQTFYKDQHVYPYTYLAGYYYRQKQYLKAVESWVKAAYVAGK